MGEGKKVAVGPFTNGSVMGGKDGSAEKNLLYQKVKSGKKEKTRHRTGTYNWVGGNVSPGLR